MIRQQVIREVEYIPEPQPPELIRVGVFSLSDLKQVMAVRELVRQLVSEMEMDEIRGYEFELVVGEAANNAVQYRPDDAELSRVIIFKPFYPRNSWIGAYFHNQGASESPWSEDMPSVEAFTPDGRGIPIIARLVQDLGGKAQRAYRNGVTLEIRVPIV